MRSIRLARKTEKLPDCLAPAVEAADCCTNRDNPSKDNTCENHKQCVKKNQKVSFSGRREIAAAKDRGSQDKFDEEEYCKQMLGDCQYFNHPWPHITLDALMRLHTQ